MSHTPGPCGCRVGAKNLLPIGGDEYVRTYEIVYCPTHTAAPDLLAALKGLDLECVTPNEGGAFPGDFVPCGECPECIARAAIAKAKEGEA